MGMVNDKLFSVLCAFVVLLHLGQENITRTDTQLGSLIRTTAGPASLKQMKYEGLDLLSGTGFLSSWAHLFGAR